MSKRTVAILDGNSLIHRAFHALPPVMTAPDGRPTNAAYGFTTMLLKLVAELRPDGVVATFDRGRPAFRTEVLEVYKIHRPPTADELKVQFPMVRQILEALGVPVLDAQGWEADDLLGTLATRGRETGVDVLLVTGDKDAFQLVEPGVSVVSTKKGITDIIVYDADGVRERLGVSPEQVADYLGLKGDTSDNIPGVPGVGEKTAVKLIAQYGSLDEVLAHADEITGKLGENLRAHADTARASREVATIRRDAPVEVDLTTVTWGEFDEPALLRVFGELQFTSLVGRVFASVGEARVVAARTGGAQVAPQTASTAATVSEGDGGTLAHGDGETVADGVEWTVLRDEAAVARVSEWIAEARNAPTGSSALLGIDRDSAPGETLLPSDDLAVARDGEVAVVCGEDVGHLLADIVRAGRVCAGDVKTLLLTMCPPGEPEAAGCEGILEDLDPTRFEDVSIAAYLLDSGRSSYDALTLYGEVFGRRLESETHGGAAAARARAALELAPVLREQLVTDGSLDCYERIELPLVSVLARMERTGVGVDTGVLAELATETRTRIAALSSEIHGLAGCEFNIDSPKQLAEVLFEKMGLPSGKRTKTGYSTDAQVLAQLAPAYPVAERIMAYRELTKLTSTYIDALPRLVGTDGRLHTTFNQTVAATGRLSSSSPNLQNIPIRSELGKRIRAAFVPAREGDLMVSADYSQIELRILAHLAEDRGLIEAFTSGADFHAATAARVFGVDPEAVTAEHRRVAKAVNFGIVYGISAHGLSESLSIGRAQAQEMIDRYYAAYPDVRTFLDTTIAEAHKNGFASTLFGRRRRIPELKSSNYNLRSFGERTAMNHPMQGTAADIMKLAMIAVDRRLREEGFESSMVLQVHDELVFEAAPKELERLSAMVREQMSGVIELTVPLVTDVSSGTDWASAK